jgi:hypothetical protein
MLGRVERNRCRSEELLESPASSESSALSEIRFPCALAYLWITSGRRNVRQVSVAFRRVEVPAKHRVNGLGELSVIPLVDATGIDPEVLQIIASGLLTAE